ncbi:MAG: hypothetical protein M1368_00195, partial [Thaumarchaeota archaeon]|nr:hypothetical protein [Nitrososphaerota archaeon]
MRNFYLIMGCLALTAVLIVGTSPIGANLGFRSAADSVSPITQEHSGLVLHNSLNATLSQQQLESSSSDWAFGGNAGTGLITLVNQTWMYSENGTENNANVAFHHN